MLDAAIQNNGYDIFTANEIHELIGKKVRFISDQLFLHPDTKEPIVLDNGKQIFRYCSGDLGRITAFNCYDGPVCIEIETMTDSESEELYNFNKVDFYSKFELLND